MATITFLHTADWQLDKPYARVKDDQKRGRLQQERVECLTRIGGMAKETGASFVVVAGDLFDSPSPTKAVVSAACAAIGAMGVPVFVIPGNHDYGGPGSLWEQAFFLSEQQQLAPNLRVLLTAAPVILPEAILFPAPLMRRHAMTDPTGWIREALEAPDLPAGLPRIVLAHGSIQGFGAVQEEDESDEEGLAAGVNLIDLGRLPEAAVDYIALGDWHGMKQVGPKAWYSGTPEIDRFPKGAGNAPGHILKVVVERGGMPLVEPMQTARFQWRELAFHFTEDASVDAFHQKLHDLLGATAQDSLLLLGLEGALGIEASQRLESLLEALEARLLRLKLTHRVGIAPSAEELAALTLRTGDPLVALVAQKLESLHQTEHGDVARMALRELHRVCAAMQ